MLIGRDRLVVETVSRVEGPLGPSETWTSGPTVWARVLPVGVMTRATYKQISGDVTHEVRVKGRWTWSLGQFRFRWLSSGNGPSMLIPADPPIQPDGTDRYTVVLCRNEVPTQVPEVDIEAQMLAPAAFSGEEGEDG